MLEGKGRGALKKHCDTPYLTASHLVPRKKLFPTQAARVLIDVLQVVNYHGKRPGYLIAQSYTQHRHASISTASPCVLLQGP
jgi:hypothetical protein